MELHKFPTEMGLITISFTPAFLAYSMFFHSAAPVSMMIGTCAVKDRRRSLRQTSMPVTPEADHEMLVTPVDAHVLMGFGLAEIDPWREFLNVAV